MLWIVTEIINIHWQFHPYAVPVKENINVGIDSPEFDYLLPEKVPFGAPLSFDQIEKMINGKTDDFAKRR